MSQGQALVTIYPPKALPGGEMGMAAVINTPRGPITVMAKGDKKMLSAYQQVGAQYAGRLAQWAGEVAKRVYIDGEAHSGGTVERMLSDVLGAVRGVVQNKVFRPPHLQTAQTGAAATPQNITFDLAYAYDAGSDDALAKIKAYKERADAGDVQAQKILDSLKLALAATQTVKSASNSDPRAVEYLGDLKRRAQADSDAKARLQYLAACRARMMIRPLLAAKCEAAKGNAAATQRLQQALRQSPDLVATINAAPPDGVYYDYDVEAQDGAEYGDVGAPFKLQLKDPYTSLRLLLKGLTLNVRR